MFCTYLLGPMGNCILNGGGSLAHCADSNKKNIFKFHRTSEHPEYFCGSSGKELVAEIQRKRRSLI